MEIITFSDLIQVGIFVVTAVAIVVTLLVTRQTLSKMLWEIRFRTLKSFEVDSDIDSYLQIHNITDNDLERYGVTKLTLKAYFNFMYSIWITIFETKGYKDIIKIRNFEEKVRVARQKGYIFDSNTMRGKLIRSEGFIKAWDLIRSFWDLGPTSVTVPLIEATIREFQHRPDLN